VHLSAPPGEVYRALATDEGRARFWAEATTESNGRLRFDFPGGQRWEGRIVERNPPFRFAVEYIGGSVATFELRGDGRGGTDLTLTDEGVPAEEWAETFAGWVSVLLALKAAVDFGVDLRNHDGRRTWGDGFVDN
jgi:uncharacterized protein YndB with AHSA1/START domain